MLTNIFDYYKQPCRPKDRANAIFVPLVEHKLGYIAPVEEEKILIYTVINAEICN